MFIKQPRLVITMLQIAIEYLKVFICTFSTRSTFTLSMKNAFFFLCLLLDYWHFPSAQVRYCFKVQHSNFVNIHSELLMA